jgi:hypothetical protein
LLANRVARKHKVVQFQKKENNEDKIMVIQLADSSKKQNN